VLAADVAGGSHGLLLNLLPAHDLVVVDVIVVDGGSRATAPERATCAGYPTAGEPPKRCDTPHGVVSVATASLDAIDHTGRTDVTDTRTVLAAAVVR